MQILPDTKIHFNDFLAQNLNEAQKAAVCHAEGSLLIIAGAGSGKTRIITARIAHLILNLNVPPHEIVALTFTNKAAQEMKERIIHFLQSDRQLPFIGTFHSYCVYLLKRYTQYTNAPFFSILDEDDQKKIITGIIARSNLTKQTNVKTVLYQISRIKNKLIQASDLADFYSHDPLLSRIYHAYEQERIASKCFDFDDLLLEGLKLFNNNEFRTLFQQNIRHILVDEYQDTNIVQHELLQRMAKNYEKECIAQSICVVGDEDQSIYSWRGATVANIINFKNDFLNTTTIKIEQNYRSVQPILHVANTVIQHNTIRNPKKLWSDKIAHDRIRMIMCLSELHEGDAIAQFLLVSTKKDPKASTAILYRTHFQSRAIEEAFIKNSIPYKIIGGTQFYERKEVKDLLAYLRLLINPFDRPSFFRVINCPLRGLGTKFEEIFYERWHQQPFLTFTDVAFSLINDKEVTHIKQSALNDFIQIFTTAPLEQLPSVILNHIINKTQYIPHLKKTYDTQEAHERIDNITELINAIKHFESIGTNTIELFLNEVALMNDLQKQQDIHANPVFMMTVHAAKGLEFDTVIIPGLEENLFPSSRSIFENEALEEERRLFYVGITRARERLLLSHCRYRYTYGQMNDQLPSRFLNEVPKEYVLQQNCSQNRPPEIKLFFSQWLNVQENSMPQSAVLTFGSATRTAPKASSNPISTGIWQKNQPVKHAKFGIGIIQDVEHRADRSYIITVKFKTETKKINAQFLEKV